MKTYTFGKQLQKLRLDREHPTAKGFYRELSDKGIVDFNYSYYVRIESGRVLPSADVLESLSTLLSDVEKSRLLKAYCHDLLPSLNRLISVRNVLSAPPAKSSEVERPASTKERRRMLSALQMECLGKSLNHYLIFLILTLSRRPLELEELLQSGIEGTQKIVDDFLTVKLLFREGKLYRLFYSDLIFPESSDPHMEKLYSNFREWNRDFSSHFSFNKNFNRHIIRRISPRYLSLIRKQSELLIELLNNSEETDNYYNEEVIEFRLEIRNGSIPG